MARFGLDGYEPVDILLTVELRELVGVVVGTAFKPLSTPTAQPETSVSVVPVPGCYRDLTARAAR